MFRIFSLHAKAKSERLLSNSRSKLSQTQGVLAQSPELAANDKVLYNSRSNWNLEMLVFDWRGENRSTRRKTSRNKEENQQQTQSTYDAGSGNRTRDT